LERAYGAKKEGPYKGDISNMDWVGCLLLKRERDRQRGSLKEREHMAQGKRGLPMKMPYHYSPLSAKEPYNRWLCGK